jgi:hypothetical protein
MLRETTPQADLKQTRKMEKTGDAGNRSRAARKLLSTARQACGIVTSDPLAKLPYCCGIGH